MQTGQLRSMSGVKYVTNIRSMGFGRVVEKVSICRRGIESLRFHRQTTLPGMPNRPEFFYTTFRIYTTLPTDRLVCDSNPGCGTHCVV